MLYEKKTQIKSQYFFVNFLLSYPSVCNCLKKRVFILKIETFFHGKWGPSANRSGLIFTQKNKQYRKKKDVFAVLVRVQQNKTPIA